MDDMLAQAASVSRGLIEQRRVFDSVQVRPGAGCWARASPFYTVAAAAAAEFTFFAKTAEVLTASREIHTHQDKLFSVGEKFPVVNGLLNAIRRKKSKVCVCVCSFTSNADAAASREQCGRASSDRTHTSHLLGQACSCARSRVHTRHMLMQHMHTQLAYMRLQHMHMCHMLTYSHAHATPTGHPGSIRRHCGLHRPHAAVHHGQVILSDLIWPSQPPNNPRDYVARLLTHTNQRLADLLPRRANVPSCLLRFSVALRLAAAPLVPPFLAAPCHAALPLKPLRCHAVCSPTQIVKYGTLHARCLSHEASQHPGSLLLLAAASYLRLSRHCRFVADQHGFKPAAAAPPAPHRGRSPRHPPRAARGTCACEWAACG